MSFKSYLPWDLEKAMTTFQVKQDWYEEYWLRDANDLTNPQVHRRTDGSIDMNYYRGVCQAREGSGDEAGLLRLACGAGSTFPACEAEASRRS